MTRQRPGDQPQPTPGEGPTAYDLVIADLREAGADQHEVGQGVIQDLLGRMQVGIERYDTPLRPNNGRDTRLDLYQELLDATVYCRTRMAECEESPGVARLGDMAEYRLLESIYPQLKSILGVIKSIATANA